MAYSQKLCLSVCGLALGVASPLYAAPQDAAQSASPALSGAPLEEVIVTVRRREESMQEVPLSVVAIGAEQLEARGIDSTENLNRQVPNLAVASTSFFGRQSAAFRMRGLPDVAVYVDGIVNSGGAGGLGSVVEVDRIEVLRGPQGTLFGKGSIGGAIQYVTRDPSPYFGARVKTTVGSYERMDVQANIDVPLSETFLTKITAAKNTRDGYLPSVTTGRRLGGQDDTIGRLEILWRPTDAFDWSVTGEYNKQSTNGNPSTVWALNPVCAGDTPPANFIGRAPNFPCVAQNIGLDVNQDYVFGAREIMKTASDYNGPDIETTIKAFRTDLNYELSDRWTLRGLGGYRTLQTLGYADFDGTPLRLFDGANYSERTERSAEVQLLFGGDRLTGTTGVYAYRDTNDGRRMNWIANDWHPLVSPELNAAARAYTGFPGPTFPSILVDSLTATEAQGWAVFAEWSYELTDKLTATLGARYNVDELETAAYTPAEPISALCCTPVQNVDRASATPRPFSAGSEEFTQVSPRASLQYQWTPDLMTYATYSQGFGAGGFNSIVSSDLPGGGLFSSYDPETLDNYEVGLRSDWLDGRLRVNLTAFLGKYEDIQVSLERILRFPTTENAGEAEVKGLELDGYLRLTDDLMINYGAGYLDSGFTGLAVGTQGITLSTPFPYAPEKAYTLGVQQDWGLANGGGLSLRGDYGWQDEQYTGLGVSASVIPAYGLASARLTYTAPSGNYDVALFGSNLTDEYYRINGFFIPADQMDNGTVGRPREWGLTVSVRFE